MINKATITILLFLSFVCFSIALTSHIARIKAAVSYGTGVYTNLCGTGTNANDHTCDQGCNPQTGSCQSNNATVVKFTCDGRQTECRTGESSFSPSQSVSGVSCGKTVQIDVFSKNCRANGGWDCNDRDIKDYLVWYSGDCSNQSSNTTNNQNNQTQPATCQSQATATIMFRKPGAAQWVDGNTMTASGLKAGEEFEVNCFAKNGSALLEGGKIELTSPQGQTSQVSSSSELRNYRSFQTGTHIFRCSSQTITNCSVSDKVVIKAAAVTNQPAQPGVGGPTQTTQPAAQSSSQPAPKPDHRSSCDSLAITNGDYGTVPSTVKFKVSGSDNLGSLQRYKVFFGDGSVVESDSAEFEHRYEASGNFTARAEIKDSKGTWKSNSNCETTVHVKSLPLESHKSACSDVEVTVDNDGRAPATARFKVNGYDNKGAIQQYRLDFGNGITKDSDGQTFEQTYTTAGTYSIKAYIKDKDGQWKGGDNNCKQTVYISTKPITKQPETGTPTLVTLVGLVSGSAGMGLQVYKRKLQA